MRDVDLGIKPQFRITAERRAASSDCCGATLKHGATADDFICENCGQPCKRLLSDPEEVVISG